MLVDPLLCAKAAMEERSNHQQEESTTEPDAASKTLWIGDLAYWMDEHLLYSLFAGTGELVTVKVIRSKSTNLSEGYGFVEFRTHAAAENVLRTYNGHPIPNTEQVFRLNWAAFGVGKAATDGGPVDHSVFVGDLAPEVTDYVLQEHFRQFFPSVRSAKVITDPLTGRSKGYGFVRFGNEQERDRGLTEMNGHYISNRPIRVSLATAKKSPVVAVPPTVTNAPHPSDFDPTNTTLFIGGLTVGVTEDDLREIFSRFGETVYVKIPQGKGCGFVQFVQRANAETALASMNGQLIGNSSIRISWGRSNSNRTPAAAAYAYQSYANTYGGFDPMMAVQAQAYAAYAQNPAGGAVDPYGAYAAYAAQSQGVDPNAALFQAYQPSGLPNMMGGLPSANPTSLAAMAAARNGGLSQQMNGNGNGALFLPKQDGLFDPLAPLDINKMNASYIGKNQSALLGSHLHV